VADSIRSESLYAKKLSELRALSDEDLVRQHDELVGGGRPIDQDYYLGELARRDIARRDESSAHREARMVELTERIRTLTWVIARLTVVNVLAAILAAASA
jgi:hypothetical protein